MGRINTGRVVLGGLLAGLIMNIGEFLLNEVVLKAQWESAMRALNLAPAGGSAIAVFVMGGFVSGLLMIWLYAAVRPRLGAGPKTAVIAGLVVWVFGSLLALMPPLLTGILPSKIVWTLIIWGVFEIPLAAAIGAWLYKE
jgi:apolipoprotein N-acyltransferase